jgi:DnaK suppressor protein
MDRVQIDAVRTVLERRLVEIRGEIANLRKPAHQADGGGDSRPQYGKRAGDHLSDVVQQRTNQAALSMVLRTEEEVVRALARLDAGTYGTCETCGKPVAPERLEAMPWATQCIACKSRSESRRR